MFNKNIWCFKLAICINRMRLIVVVFILFLKIGFSQEVSSKLIDTLVVSQFERGYKNVNKCTPLDHLKCVYITGKEVYEDGRQGKSTRHWWRMSYIGRACKDQHGSKFGHAFEGFFAVPHYISIAIANGISYVVYIVRGAPEKVKERKQKRKDKREQRKLLKQK